MLTFWGTLEQGEHTLYATQQKYFESLFLVHWVADVVPIPMPGAYLVLVVLFVNMTLGGIVRVKKAKRKIGVLLGHTGILVLLIGGFVSFNMGQEGNMKIFEQESSDVAVNDRVWEIGIVEMVESGTTVERVIPGKTFDKLAIHESRTIDNDVFPFKLTVSGFSKNCIPQKAGATSTAQAKVIDGFSLRALKNASDALRNVPGAYVLLESRTGADSSEGILWGRSLKPLVVSLDGRKWSIELRNHNWYMPFSLALNKFTRELYPRTGIPKVFASDVTLTDGGVAQDIRISMNEPLRHRGYTFYQSSFGEDRGRVYTVLSVSKNPAYDFPIWACAIMTLGMAIHFMQTLINYLKREKRTV